MDGPTQGTPTANFARDTRSPGLVVQSINRIGNAAGGIGGNQLEQITAAANVDAPFSRALPIVLHPGHNVQMWNNTINSAIVALAAGYEFNALPQELAS
jgi:hypothetical protein